MSTCRYCVHYVRSARRLEGKSDGEKQRRLCDATKTWKSSSEEICDNFVTDNRFWCDKLQCDMDIDSCRNKKAKKLHKYCKHCSQYFDIVEVLKYRKRTESQRQAVLEAQPVQLRRRS